MRVDGLTARLGGCHFCGVGNLPDMKHVVSEALEPVLCPPGL